MANKLFVDYFEDWIETYKLGSVRDVTIEKYRMTAKRLKEIAPKLTIKDLDRQAYQKIINEYAKTHERQTTVDFNTQLKASIKYLVYDGIIKKDPTFKVVVKGKQQRQKRRKFLDTEEVSKLICTLDLKNGINFDWFILLSLKTGTRFSEIMAITPNDFDWENQTLTLSKTWNYKKSKQSSYIQTLEEGFETGMKNQSSHRVISIDWQIVGQLRPIVSNLPQDEPMFVEKTEKGYKNIFNSTYNHALGLKCKEAGISEISLHGLRHTHGSILLSKGVSIQTISKRLGHSDTITTQKVYLHIVDELERKDTQLINSVLSGIG